MPAEMVLAAIDVGTNATRLKLARPRPSGGLEPIHEERDPIRPGEGVFKTGAIPPAVAERLLATLRRYGATCRRHDAIVRAVATSAVREARNGPAIVERARDVGVELEVISGREEARLTCLGVLLGTPPGRRSLLVDIGGGSTEVATASGEHPSDLYTLALGAVRLTEIFGSAGAVGARKLRLMRDYAAEVAERGLPSPGRGARRAIGSSGTIRAVVGFAAGPEGGSATVKQIARAVDELGAMSAAARRRSFDPARAEIIVAGAVVLEAVARRLSLSSIAATDLGLRDGVLVDLLRRQRHDLRANELVEVAASVGRWFRFDEDHGRQVARTALVLFDALAADHDLPERARGWLEVAALLHDIGHLVGHGRHHKHTHYLIRNTDIPGLADHEREIVAAVARFHRRSDPDAGHKDLEGLSGVETRLVRKLSALLRLADALDRSHHQPIARLRAAERRGMLRIEIAARAPVELELWDVERETPLFRRVFRMGVDVKTASA
jgi:exopolyphosphatase / guanosine-5'-triphosphate,3'-diphosphate pyrophosphatase